MNLVFLVVLHLGLLLVTINVVRVLGIPTLPPRNFLIGLMVDICVIL